jgi:hypothetical protein
MSLAGLLCQGSETICMALGLPSRQPVNGAFCAERLSVRTHGDIYHWQLIMTEGESAFGSISYISICNMG